MSSTEWLEKRANQVPAQKGNDMADMRKVIAAHTEKAGRNNSSARSMHLTELGKEVYNCLGPSSSCIGNSHLSIVVHFEQPAGLLMVRSQTDLEVYPTVEPVNSHLS